MNEQSKLLNLENARKKDQLKLMEKITHDGVCPFCQEHLSKYHPKPVLFKTEFWTITENAWPYDFTKKHFLVIYNEHINHNSEISPKGWSEIGLVIKKLEEEYGLKYGTLLMRFGDTKKTGATVTHLHFQLVQSDPSDPDYDPKKGLLTRIG